MPRHGHPPYVGLLVAAIVLGLNVQCRSPEAERPAPGADADASEADSDAVDASEAGAMEDRASQDDGDAPAGEVSTLVPGWSVRKRLRSAAGRDLVLEEVPVSFTVASFGPSRVRLLATDASPERSWVTPDGTYLADVCWHPSGEVSAVLVASDFTVSLARLDANLVSLSFLTIHDPAIATDPHVTDAGALDLRANGFASDAARIGATGEDAVVVVDTSWNSIIAYGASFTGAWSVPRRTLLEPPAGLTPFLPISGTFDTFGAIVAWFRSPLDVDEQGNAYIAVWANPSRIRAHTAFFQDGLAPLPDDGGVPGFGDSDILVTKMGADGQRAWTRVIGTSHEDEPYGIRARAGVVAVVGRSRRFPGVDNTVWDAFLGVSSAAGDPIVSRTIPLDASGILLAVDVLPQGGLVVGGSDGWSQNPDGLSVLSFGAKTLLVLPAFDAEPVRVSLLAGPRNNELRTLVADADRTWFGGDEDGPVMHTADGDLSQIHATGVLGSVPR
jgi:hypothetical protein